MALRYTKRILSHIAHPTYRPVDAAQMAVDLGVAKTETEAFTEAIERLAQDGQVVLGDNAFVNLPPMGSEVVGSFKRNVKGFGFVIPREVNAHGDLFVPAKWVGDAMTGDEVRAEVVKQPGRGGPGASPFVGRIAEVIRRQQTTFTGVLRKDGGQWLVFPDGKALTDPVAIADAESKNGKDGDKVAFEITLHAEGDYLAEGVITNVLGESGEPSVETQAIIEAYGLPGDFPGGCLDQARSLSESFAEQVRSGEEAGFDPAERLDLRDTFIITIDPPDAKDYDDAISLERIELSGGDRGWRLGVHIADVSAFVTPGSPLDEEARDRGNSVYLPRLVIPMLPEILSNGICSLQEGVPRFCKTVFVDYDERGRVRGQGFAATVIHSAKRLTYLEAQALIDGNEEEATRHARTEPAYDERLMRTLRDMNTLSRSIRKRRHGEGMIHLDLPDVELVYDGDGRVVDAVEEDDAYTHTLIEMFMVEANEAVARLFEELEVPVLRRVHPEPVPGNMEQLRDFVKVAGFRIPKSPTREELQALLDATAGSPAAPAVHFAVLRTLTRAEYSPALIGHFALASGAYAHFTSPIRRYPDLTVHRALTRYLELTDNEQRRPRGESEKKRLGRELKEDPACPDEQALVGIGNRCNQREENATNAERELRQFLVLQLLSEHIGESFPGLVTGVSAAGVFVRLDKYLAEGLVKTSDLPVIRDPKKPNAYARSLWKLDRRTGSLVEQNSGRSFQMGDRLAVTVLEIDLPRRQMNLGVTDPESRAAGKDKQLAAKAATAKDVAEQGVSGGIAAGLRLGDVIEEDKRSRQTGAQRRSQKSKSRDQRKGDFRKDRKNKGKRQ